MAKLAFILTIACLLASTRDVYAEGEKNSLPDTDTNNNTGTCTENLVYLSYYIHFLGLNHPNTTTYEVARASITDTSPTAFGSVRVIDHLVTEGPDPTLPQLGRCQGIFARSDLSVPANTLNVNIYFTAGKYAGSTLSVLGRYEVGSNNVEVTIAGGTRAFRFAHGYSTQTIIYPIGGDSAILGFEDYITFTADCESSGHKK